MRKVVKPLNQFRTKLHSYSPTMLQDLQNQIFTNKNLKRTQEWFSLLSSETRLHILFLLSKREFLCVGDIADTLRIDISAVSHQLRLLRRENLVKSQRKGKVVYYRLDRTMPSLVKSLLTYSG